jgi:Spy/CpxP family protein refolding chaperone
MIRKIVIALVLGLSLGCATKSRPLPGDSVSDEGGVTLSPPRLSTPTTSSSEAEKGTGPIEARLFPPELAMERQEELGITEEQRRALIAETERGNSEVVRLQWELEREKEKLVKLLEPDRVDEAKVKEAAARVTDREGKVKLAYLAMLVRVKNLLTPEQKQKLRDRRAEPHKAPRGPVDGGTND